MVEANVQYEKESFTIVGLPVVPIKKSKECILSYQHTLGIDITMKKITIHLSPADASPPSQPN
ncbi:magnesium chelatase domain-containing protein [Psychrobacillus glaciei]|uniref:magnesium chelatase domain-containing protein n=1 Tax=Psychrobacillus glaciei TaxID=2283160 RepID=UPI00178C329F